MSTPELQIRISAELTEIKGALAQLQRDLGRTASTVEKTSAQASAGMDRFRQATGRATQALKGMIAAFGGFLIVRQLVQTADTMNLIAARIKIVSASTEDAARAQEELFQIAQRTRSGLEETANLYVRIAQSVKGSGINQEEILGLTETINQAVQLSGASAESANAALIQLGQGLASGTLRGEELNSVLEQTPRLADAIAAGMGKTRGELRKLGQEGKLTGEEVVRSLQKQKDVIAKEFATLPLTVGQSLTKISNSFKKLVSEVDRAVTGSQGLAGIFSDFADYLSSPEVIDAVINFTTVFAEGMRDVVSTMQEAFRIIDEAIGGIGDRADTLTGFLVRAFAELPINVKTFIQLAVVEVAAVVDKLIANARLAKETIKAIFTETTIAAAVAGAKAEIDAIEQARDETIAAILAERARVIAAGEEAKKAAQDRRKLAGTASEGGGAGGGKPKAGPQLDELAIVKDATKRAIEEVQRLYDAAEIGLDEYLQKRTDLLLVAIDAEIAAEKKKVAAGGTGADAALTQLVLLENAKTDVLRQGENDRDTILKEYADRRRDLTIAALEASGQTAEAKALEIQAKYEETLKRFKADADAEGVAIVEGLIKTETVAAKLDEVKQQFDDALADLRAKEQSIANQVQAGLISELSGERNLQEIRAKSIAQLRDYLALMQKLAEESGDKEALKLIDEYKLKLEEAAIVTDDFKSRVEDIAVDNIVTAFTSLIDGSKSVSEAFRDMARQFALAVAQMIIQAYALAAVRAIMSGFGGGGAVPVAHAGGIIGPGWSGPKRNVNPLVFAGAPRMHSGGMTGLKAGEVPAILQTGEEVLSRDDPRNAMNGGSSGGAEAGAGVRIINVLDPNLVSDAMGSATGERAIMNVIQRNASGISRMLR